jgi:hypothetical protein
VTGRSTRSICKRRGGAAIDGAACTFEPPDEAGKGVSDAFAEDVGVHGTPEPPVEPDFAEARRPFQAKLLQTNHDRLAGRSICLAQPVLLPPVGDLQCQAASLCPALPIKFTKMCCRLLDGFAATTH